MKMPMRFAVCLAAITVVVGCATACSVTVNEQRLFYPGPASTKTLPGLPKATVERVTVAASDRTTLSGVRIVQPSADTEILYFGGNAMRADDMVEYLGPILAGTSANLTMFDYRGYGQSEGKPTVGTMKSDAIAAFGYVQSRANGRAVIVHGVSLGGFVAAYLAANLPVRGLVLEATAPDAAAWANNQVPSVAKPFTHLTIAPEIAQESNIEAVKKYAGPLLLIAGSKDSVTPPRFMQQLLEASPSSLKQMITAKGARHGNALTYPEVREAFQKFLVVARLSVPK